MHASGVAAGCSAYMYVRACMGPGTLTIREELPASAAWWPICKVVARLRYGELIAHSLCVSAHVTAYERVAFAYLRGRLDASVRDLRGTR